MINTMSGSRGTTLAMALLAVAALAACARKDTNVTDTTAMATAPAAGMAATDTGMRAGTGSSTSMNNMSGNAAAGNNMGANMSSMPMASDADIVAMVAAANRGEIAAGRMAESKATNPAVRAFGRDMVADHTMLLNKGQALARRLNITPAPSADSAIVAMNDRVSSELSNAAKGAGFDSLYVNTQVQGHQMTLDMLRNAEGKAQNPQLRTMLNDAQPVVQRHLDRIRDLQGKMK